MGMIYSSIRFQQLPDINDVWTRLRERTGLDVQMQRSDNWVEFSCEGFTMVDVDIEKDVPCFAFYSQMPIAFLQKDAPVVYLHAMLSIVLYEMGGENKNGKPEWTKLEWLQKPWDEIGWMKRHFSINK